MAFANERITGNDWGGYNIPEIERRIVPGDYSVFSACAIDHDWGGASICLMLRSNGNRGRI